MYTYHNGILNHDGRLLWMIVDSINLEESFQRLSWNSKALTSEFQEILRAVSWVMVNVNLHPENKNSGVNYVLDGSVGTSQDWESEAD